MKISIKNSKQFQNLGYYQYPNSIYARNAVCPYCGNIVKLDWIYDYGGYGYPVELELCCDKMKKIYNLMKVSEDINNRIEQLQVQQEQAINDIEQLKYTQIKDIKFIVSNNKIFKLKQINSGK